MGSLLLVGRPLVVLEDFVSGFGDMIGVGGKIHWKKCDVDVDTDNKVSQWDCVYVEKATPIHAMDLLVLLYLFSMTILLRDVYQSGLWMFV